MILKWNLAATLPKVVILAGSLACGILSGCAGVPVADTGNRGLLQQQDGATSAELSNGAVGADRSMVGTAIDPGLISRSESGYLWPVREGSISSPYGERKLRLRRVKSRKTRTRHHFHEGIDIKANRGSPVFAVKDGVVLYSSRKIKGYGYMVVIKHDDGIASVYAHNRKNLVKKGEQVTQGQIIAQVGATGKATGPHLHFELRKGELPEDPMQYLPPLRHPAGNKPAVAQSEDTAKTVN